MLKEGHAPTYPLSINVFYGSDFDPSIKPVAFVIPSPAAFAAFVQGGNEIDGWMDATFMDHGNYKVNIDGEAIEGKIPEKKALPNERFVLWGENPERGAKPQRYVFEDEQCAQAFEDGVNARSGWTDMNFVPGSDYRAYRDLEHALKEVDAPIATLLRAVVELEDDDLGEFDPIFINAQGQYVQEGWSPGDYICNEPVDAQGWADRFNDYMVEVYGMSAAEAGFSEASLQALNTGPYVRFPEVAAGEFGDKNQASVSKPPTPRQSRP